MASAVNRLSFSRLEKFETCPYAFYLRYLLRIPEPPNKAMELGKLTHELIKIALTTGEAPEAAVAQAAAKYATLGEKETEEAVNMAYRFLRDYRLAEWHASEYEIQEKIDGVPFYLVLDLVERVDGTLVITDFKTDWEPYDPGQKKQLPLYAYFAAKHFGVSRVLMRLWFLRYSPKNKEKRPVREEPATPEVVTEAVGWVRDVVKRIREAEELPGAVGFPPAPGTACNYCGYAYSLRCLEETFASGQFDGDPVFLAGLALRLERALEDIKDKLKEHIRATGAPVEVGGEYYDFYRKSVWEFPDVRRLTDVLAGAGEDPWKYLRVDGWELRRLFRKKPDLEPVIRSFGEEKVETYFSHRSQPGSAAEGNAASEGE